MSLQSLQGAIKARVRILLDSTCLIAHLDGGEPASPVATHVIDEMVRRGRNEAIVSMVSVMEVLVRPLQRSLPEYEHALDFLTRFPNLHTKPIDLPVAQEAAGVRATQRLKPPDSLVIATAIVHQVGVLVTNDDRWKRITDDRLQVVYLEDHRPFP